VTPRFSAILVRLLVLVSVWLLGTSTLSLAQETTDTGASEPAGLPQTEPAEDGENTILVVPNVRGLPYVFAKGVLEDAGFAWKVKGKVEGLATNIVAEQSVKPGARVLDTGAPTIVLHLDVNPDYDEVGMPDNASPYPGTKVVLATEIDSESAATPENQGVDGTDDQNGGQAGAQSQETEPSGAVTEPAEPEPADTEPADVQTADYEEASNVATDAASEANAEQSRPAAFSVPGAPREPLNEISLPDRASNLRDWVADLKELTAAGLDHFSYQHAWVVTGAEFGWWQGAEALRTLIDADELLQKKFGTGARFEAVARAALAEVESKSASG
jgi:hypothetical protein